MKGLTLLSKDNNFIRSKTICNILLQIFRESFGTIYVFFLDKFKIAIKFEIEFKLI